MPLIRQGKEREVIKAFYKKVFPNIRKYVVTHGGSETDAQDAFHDGLMRLFTLVMDNGLDEKYTPYGFVYRHGITCWINYIKKQSRQIPVDPHDMEIPVTAHAEPAIRKPSVEEENTLLAVFAPIGEKCSELLSYMYYYDLLMEDIKIRMELPSVEAVKMQAQRCKKKLMEEIKKNPRLMDLLKNGRQ